MQILKIRPFKNLLSNDVVPLLVLEVLVHLHDVRVVLLYSKIISLIKDTKGIKVKALIILTYQLSKNIDFVEEHFLLIFVHVTLAQNFNGSLCASFSMNAHSHFSERTYAKELAQTGQLTTSKHLADSVKVTKFSCIEMHQILLTEGCSRC